MSLYTKEQIREARDYYLKENEKVAAQGKRNNTREFLKTFNVFPDRMNMTDSNVKEKYFRIEGMLERYFRLKELGPL